MALDVGDVERSWHENYATALHALSGHRSMLEAERVMGSDFYPVDEAAARAADAQTKRQPGMTPEAWQRFTNQRAQRGQPSRPAHKRGETSPRSTRRVAAKIDRRARS